MDDLNFTESHEDTSEEEAAFGAFRQSRSKEKKADLSEPPNATVPQERKPEPALPPGTGYWDIVVRQFRKNRLARFCLWICLLLFAIAIFAPFLANQNPFAFQGYYRALYETRYKEWSIGGHRDLERMPSNHAKARADLKSRKIRLSRLKRLISEQSWADILKLIEPAEEHFRSSVWKRLSMPLSDFEKALAREDWERLAVSLDHTAGELDTIFRERLDRQLTGLETQLVFLASQLAASYEEKAEAFLSRYRKLASGNYLTAPEEEQQETHTKLQTLRGEIEETFEPEKVQFVSKLWFPLFDSLGWLDIFFMVLALMFILMPLIGRSFGTHREELFGRRTRKKLLIMIVPALACSGLWLLKPTMFQKIDYKDEMAEGRIVAEWSMFPPVKYDLNEEDSDRRYEKPSRAHLMGTDGIGRDIMTRMIWGSRVSLSVGFVAVSIYFMIGITVGGVAGYFGGLPDIIISRVIEWVICFPRLILILAIVAVLQPSMFNIMIVLGLTGWTTVARLTRGEFLRLRNHEYVLAARALGSKPRRIIFRHLLPNSLAPALVAASFGIAAAILIESTLSFLGVGITIPTPSWGGILSDARKAWRYWWITMFPGAAIFLAVTVYNLVGEGIRDALDPRLKVG